MVMYTMQEVFVSRCLSVFCPSAQINPMIALFSSATRNTSFGLVIPSANSSASMKMSSVLTRNSGMFLPISYRVLKSAVVAVLIFILFSIHCFYVIPVWIQKKGSVVSGTVFFTVSWCSIVFGSKYHGN